MEPQIQSLSIPETYRDLTVLITGGTGFMGKVLTEKLLRSCPDLRHIYLLIREKKGKPMHQRLDDIFQDPLFSVLEKEQPKFRYKISGIASDIAVEGLALKPEDRKILQDEVDVVIHGAATVRFDEKIKIAYNINIRGTKEMLILAREITNLKAFIHISTAYSNCTNKNIEEKLYAPPAHYSKIAKIVENVDDDSLLELLLPGLLGEWPNTYTFTKAIAENVVKELGEGLPVRIFRPSIVVATAYEPLIGWVDNLYGPTGMIIGAGCGVLRTAYVDLESISDVVPVDMCVNAIIAVTWETMCGKNKNTNTKTREAITNEENINKTLDIMGQSEPPVYNFVSTIDKPLRWRDLKYYIELHGKLVPTLQCIWYYSLNITSNRYLYVILMYLLHYLPALLIDGAAKLAGKDSPNLYKLYQKIEKVTRAVDYFATRSWSFTNDRTRKLWNSLTPQDQKTFHFDIKQLDWSEYFHNYIKGCRVYILKDDLSTLPEATVRWRRFYWAHQVLKLIFFYSLFRFVWFVISAISPILA